RDRAFPRRSVCLILEVAIHRVLLIALGAAALLVGEPSAPAALNDNGVTGDDSPSWSPTGNEIAYTSFQHGHGDIYVMRPDGSDKRRLTTDPAYDDIPTFSPNGGKIAFVSSRSGSLQIWVMDADGSDQHQLTASNGTNYFPTWSPD